MFGIVFIFLVVVVFHVMSLVVMFLVLVFLVYYLVVVLLLYLVCLVIDPWVDHHIKYVNIYQIGRYVLVYVWLVCYIGRFWFL